MRFTRQSVARLESKENSRPQLSACRKRSWGLLAWLYSSPAYVRRITSCSLPDYAVRTLDQAAVASSLGHAFGSKPSLKILRPGERDASKPTDTNRISFVKWRCEGDIFPACVGTTLFTPDRGICRRATCIRSSSLAWKCLLERDHDSQYCRTYVSTCGIIIDP